jgi:8-amino-7-oxononanoate synthase
LPCCFRNLFRQRNSSAKRIDYGQKKNGLKMRFEPIEKLLKGIESRSGFRRLMPRQGSDFSSNDYLGLASSRRMKDAVMAALHNGTPLGAGGSRLLRGNCEEHEQLEADAVAFFRADACLFFGGGYQANTALFSTLPQRGDLVVYDELIHASTHEGMRASKADVMSAAHNDAQAVGDAIRLWRAKGGKGRPWIAVESLYSMDGDCAPLEELNALAIEHEGFLVIDEAHSTGVFGPEGRGFSAAFEGQEHIVTLHTCGKALGASGALVMADKRLIELLVNRARAFIFATAPSPLVAVAVREALMIVQQEPERRTALADLVSHTRNRLNTLGLPASPTQIQPVIIGENARALAMANRLQEAGFDVRAIRPPTVPPGTARLRLSITLNVARSDIDAVMDELAVK